MRSRKFWRDWQDAKSSALTCISTKGPSCLTHLSTVTFDWCEATTRELAAGSPFPGEFIIHGSAGTTGHSKEDGTKGYFSSTVIPKPQELECLVYVLALLLTSCVTLCK